MSAAEIRGQVNAANELVVEAQHFLNQAQAKLEEAKHAYEMVQTDKLNTAVGAAVQSAQSVEEATRISHGIVASADAYTSRI